MQAPHQLSIEAVLPADTVELPASLRRGHWSITELKGVIALAHECPPPKFLAVYRQWAADNGYKLRRIRRILGTFKALGLEIPGFSVALPWSEPELNRLHALSSDYPPRLIVGPYSSWALRSGYQPRLQSEVLQAMADHFNLTTWRPIGQWLHVEDVATMLEVELSICRRWIYNETIRSHREPDGNFFLHRASFEHTARYRPADLAVGACPHGLLALLSKPYLVRRVLKQPYQKAVPTARPRPVQSLTDLRWWPSPHSAATALDIPAEIIERSAASGIETPYGQFRYVAVPARLLQAA
jgi:hypothetical protein